MDATDSDLVRRARLGDQRSFHALVDRHADGLYRLARALVGGHDADAEDVVQETFVGALEKLDAFEGRSSVKTWLTGILINQARNFRRRRRVRRAASIDDEAGAVAADGARPGMTAVAPQGQAATVERQLDVSAMLGKLSAEHREVLVLRHLKGFSYEQIADLLGVPTGTIESRISRARQAVREQYGDYLKEGSPSTRERRP